MRPNLKPLTEKKSYTSDICYLWIDDPAMDDYLSRKESDILQPGTISSDGTFIPCRHSTLGERVKVFLTNLGNAKDICNIYNINPHSEAAAIYDESLNPVEQETLMDLEKRSLFENSQKDPDVERYYTDPDYVPGVDDDEDEDKISKALDTLKDTDADTVYDALDRLRSGESLSGIEQDEIIGILSKYDTEDSHFLKKFVEEMNTSEYNNLGVDMRTGTAFVESVNFIHGLRASLKECDKLNDEDKEKVCKECEDALEESKEVDMPAEEKADLREAAMYCITYLRG